MMKNLYLLTFVLLLFSIVSVASERDSMRSYTIDDVVVKSYRSDIMLKDVPNKIEVISSGQILRTPALTIADLIKKNTPCQSVDIHGLNAGIDFRGFAPGAMGVNKYSSILMDGMPIGTMNLATTSLAGIGSIEILKGPFSSLYGSGAMGGVINIISAQSRGAVHGTMVFGIGSWQTMNSSFVVGGSISKSVDFDFTLDYASRNRDFKTGKRSLLHTSDYENIVMDDWFGKSYPNSTFDKTNATLRVGYDINSKWRVNFFNSLYITDRAMSNSDIWGSGGSTDKGVKRNLHRIDLSYTTGRHNVRFSPYFSIQSSGSDYASSWGATSDQKRYTTYGFQLQDAVDLGVVRLTYGLDSHSQRNNTSAADADGKPTAPWQPNYLSMQNSAFVQAHVSLFDNKLISIAGVRYDNTLMRTFRTELLDMESSSNFYNSFNPNFALRYKIIPLLNAHASIGRSFLAPDPYLTVGQYATFGTIYYGNRDLKPETAVTTDLGLGYVSKNGALELDFTLFWTTHDNLIGTKELVAWQEYTYENADKATMNGYEIMASVDFGRALSKPWSAKLFANYMKIYKSDVLKEGVRSERLYVSRNNVTFGAEYVNKIFSVRLAGRYLGDKLNEDFIMDGTGAPLRKGLNGEKIITLPDFMVFDLYADCRVWKGLSVGVKCANLFDENYMERDGYFLQGRSVSAELSLRF